MLECQEADTRIAVNVISDWTAGVGFFPRRDGTVSYTTYYSGMRINALLQPIA
jgi:hypothetical protein